MHKKHVCYDHDKGCYVLKDHCCKKHCKPHCGDNKEINIGNPVVNVHVNSCGDGKKEDDKHCEKKKKSGRLTKFAFDTESSTNPFTPNTPLQFNIPTLVATAALGDLRAGNKVWLNGLFHLNNDTTVPSAFRARIYKNSITPTNLIYDSLMEIDSEFRDDFNQPIPVQHVDAITSDEVNVQYILTVESASSNASLFLRGPITFTASEIKG